MRQMFSRGWLTVGLVVTLGGICNTVLNKYNLPATTGLRHGRLNCPAEVHDFPGIRFVL